MKTLLMLFGGLIVFSLCLLPGQAWAGEADVLDVQVHKKGGGYSFSVTVRHADEGWDHYADRWEVMTTGGEVLAKRVLMHPHVDEQPFTRNLAGIRIPDGISKVVVRAHDKVHGYGGREMEIQLPVQ